MNFKYGVFRTMTRNTKIVIKGRKGMHLPLACMLSLPLDRELNSVEVGELFDALIQFIAELIDVMSAFSAELPVIDTLIELELMLCVCAQIQILILLPNV